jgi:YD repeat-containing protein
VGQGRISEQVHAPSDVDQSVDRVAGNVIQNAREERFQWSASGLLIRAQKKNGFDVRYFYDQQRRLMGRKDHHGI